MFVGEDISPARQAEGRVWYGRLVKASNGNLAAALPGLTAFDVRVTDHNSRVYYTFKFWFGERLTTAQCSFPERPTEEEILVYTAHGIISLVKNELNSTAQLNT